ncbi:Tmh11p KNAG_0D01490 [Huiozyma naganishii CBS 8797]|uniref:Uncharacterized protein n=1 Tax=Huiozyma naganishii (strain ATCC MYA-139 / BCRC 22969 / CBS 8797 / KCTC 17520 / NBRC 10181 / NCYC 3082 / Yp74L-3) TaxID=1071383 RepID=J7S6Q4_HUIN7|nr:hypothetical protein KNAG_0D01490 [Kazachstania naganishii CBS 8797]CCK69901.1 hypothetical protein KNAG_0D01490 [Kazachstania naganishii CBS 8797]
MDHPAKVLCLLCSVGGVIGYARKGSVPSIVAGVTLGVSYGISAYLLHKNADWGLEIAIASSTVLAVAGVVRGVPSRFTKPVPCILTLLGSLGTAYYVYKYSQFYR